MKFIKRDPLKFDVFNALAQFSQGEKLSIHDPKITESFIGRIRSSVNASRDNDAFLFGQRTQAMFEALVVSLGKIVMMKQEDAGEVFTAVEEVGLPDERLVFHDGTQMLVEVKNHYQKKDPFEPMVLEEKYVNGLNKYASLMGVEFRLATYWVNFNQWTLVSSSTLERKSGKAILSWKDAFMFNEMATLGDMMIGTKLPLAITVVTDRNKPRPVGGDGMVSFHIADMKISCAGNFISSQLERNIAWYLIMHGDWEEQEPEAKITDGQLDEITFEWLPNTYHAEPDKYDEQGFAIIGSLSGMFSRYYRQMTLQDGRIGQIRVDVSPGSLGQLIPEDYKGQTLPLWRMVQQPKDRQNNEK
ncbi:MAG: hypothetical protein ACREI2_01875 [Nitrospiraceae bacterium]